jgi:hypothetical protein
LQPQLNFFFALVICPKVPYLCSPNQRYSFLLTRTLCLWVLYSAFRSSVQFSRALRSVLIRGNRLIQLYFVYTKFSSVSRIRECITLFEPHRAKGPLRFSQPIFPAVSVCVCVCVYGVEWVVCVCGGGKTHLSSVLFLFFGRAVTWCVQFF